MAQNCVFLECKTSDKLFMLSTKLVETISLLAVGTIKLTLLTTSVALSGLLLGTISSQFHKFSVPILVLVTIWLR